MKLTHKTIQGGIKEVVSNWTHEIEALDKQKIVAINFGLQKVWDGFELYLSGHSWYDEDDDLWLLDKDWFPIQNYISLGQGSLQFDRLEMLELYEKIVSDEIKEKKTLYKKLEMVVVGLVDGPPSEIEIERQRHEKTWWKFWA